MYETKQHDFYYYYQMEKVGSGTRETKELKTQHKAVIKKEGRLEESHHWVW